MNTENRKYQHDAPASKSLACGVNHSLARRAGIESICEDSVVMLAINAIIDLIQFDSMTDRYWMSWANSEEGYWVGRTRLQ